MASYGILLVGQDLAGFRTQYTRAHLLLAGRPPAAASLIEALAQRAPLFLGLQLQVVTTFNNDLPLFG